MDIGISGTRVRRPRVLLVAACSCGALATMGGLPAHAQTSVSASSTYSLDGGAPTTVSQSTPTFPSPNILPSASDSGGDSIFGHVYGDPTGGSFFGTRSSGQGNYSITGTLDYQTVFANTTGVVVDPTLAFVIDAGQLNVNLQSSSPASQSAGLNAVISESINGGTPIDLFDYASSMTATDHTADPSFSESGAVFNPSGPTYSAGEADYSWSAYDGSVSLGPLNPGDSVLIDYNLVSSASGTGTCEHVVIGSLGFITNASGGPSVCDSALARIGDPYTVTADSPVGTPEPASAALLGAGLASLAFLRRRRRPA